MLTDKQIRDAKPRATVYRLRDTQSVCRGFGVVVAPSGSKSFFLSFTSPEDGKRKQVSLGKYPSTKFSCIFNRRKEHCSESYGKHNVEPHLAQIAASALNQNCPARPSIFIIEGFPTAFYRSRLILQSSSIQDPTILQTGL